MNAAAFAQSDVTFSVDMEIYDAKDLFDPATDTVWIAGSMNDWNAKGHIRTETDEEYVYEVTLPLEDGEYF